jgi:hypothetical protein
MVGERVVPMMDGGRGETEFSNVFHRRNLARK